METLDTPEAPVRRPAAGANSPRVWLLWAWRQLTSMRVALLLLLLIAVAAVPGSLWPQRPQDPAGVLAFAEANPGAYPILNALGVFDVFASPWFMAIAILLFVSLVGCIVPRIKIHVRALRNPPPPVPRSLTRFPARQTATLGISSEEVYARAGRALKGRYRTRLDERGLAAERGYLRETGNIVFHLALLGILLSFAYGQMSTYRGQAIVVEGESFANSVLDYDSFTAGTFVDEGALIPFQLTLDKLHSLFDENGRPTQFLANVTVREGQAAPSEAEIEPNEPLRMGGTAVYLSGNGYAPRIEVRDADGNLAFAGPVPFLPQDDFYTSTGVIKVPDVTSGDQLGFTGQLLPSATETADGQLFSRHPDPAQPLIVLNVWRGDLGLDDGVPRNVYELDTEEMTQLDGEGGVPLVIGLAPGDTVTLPDGLGEITFVDLPRFAALDLRHDPSLTWLLWTSVASMLGLMGSLFTPRRRLWVRATPGEEGTAIEIAALARGEDAGTAADVEMVLDAVRKGTE